LDRGFVWVPRPSYKIYTSVLINNVEMKSKVLDCTITRIVTDGAGSCELRIYNKDGQYTGTFSKKYIIKIYIDYVNGTTKVFEGLVRDIEYDLDPYSVLVVKGYDYAGDALERVVNKVYTTATAISDIFKQLIATYLPDHTTTNVATISTTAKPTFNNKKLLDCLKDLMKLTNNNYCFYCDFNKDWHVFEKGSIYNEDEPILHTKNLLSLKTEDTLSDVATKITLYGLSLDNYPLMVTVKDDAAIAQYGTIHEVIKDTNISTWDALVEKANEILTSKKTGEIKGKRVTARGLPGLTPGDQIYIFAPEQSIQGEYFIPEYTHEIRGGKIMKTTCKFQVQHKRVESIITVIKDRADESQGLMSIENPNDLEHSYNFTFDDDTNCTHSNTETEEGKLRIAATYASGTMTSTARTAEDLITKVEVRASGQDLRSSTFEVSADNGANWLAVSLNTLYTLTTTGKQLKVRVTLVSNSPNPDPSVEALAVLYK